MGYLWVGLRTHPSRFLLNNLSVNLQKDSAAIFSPMLLATERSPLRGLALLYYTLTQVKGSSQLFVLAAKSQLVHTHKPQRQQQPQLLSPTNLGLNRTVKLLECVCTSLHQGQMYEGCSSSILRAKSSPLERLLQY